MSIALLPEEEAKKDQKLELKQWNGISWEFGKSWEVISSMTEVNLYFYLFYNYLATFFLGEFTFSGR